MEIRRSEHIAELVAAVAKASLEFDPILRDGINLEYGSDFSSLAHLIGSTKPALNKHGVAVFQFPRVAQGKTGPAVEVTTMLCCGDQFLAFELPMPAKFEDGRFDCQTIGMAITYARRYSYESVICVAGTHDDDGNQAAGFPARNGEKSPAPSKKVGPQSEGGGHQMKLAVGSSNGPYSPPDNSSGGYSL